MSSPDLPLSGDFNPKVGDVVSGRFELLREIGEGGMGKVFVALQLNMNREVVVKLLKPELCNNAEQVERFKREAELAARLSHPNSVVTHDFGVEHGVPFIVMEYLRGEPLSERIFREKRLSIAESARIIIEVCHSVKEAHDLGMIHRDLKPENILLLSSKGQEGQVKVVDFGIAKLITSHPDAASSNLTKGDMIFGTPQYMAPEQIRGKELDARADIYALGVILYQSVMGRLPYDSQVVVDILTQHLTKPIPTPTLEELPALSTETLNAFNKLLSKTMAKRADDRIHDVLTLISELQKLREIDLAPSLGATAPLPNSAQAQRSPSAESSAESPLERAELKTGRARSLLSLALLLLAVAAVFVTIQLPELTPGGQGWGPWAQEQWARYTKPQASSSDDQSRPIVREIIEPQEPTQESSERGDEQREEALLVDELIAEAELTQETATEETAAEETAAEETATEETATEEAEQSVKPWTLVIKTKSQEMVSVKLFKDQSERALRELKVNSARPKALRLHPSHSYKVICSLKGREPKDKLLQGEPGEVKRLRCF